MTDFPRYEVITQIDPATDDIIIPLPLPVLKNLGWKEGDEITVSADENGFIQLRK